MTRAALLIARKDLALIEFRTRSAFISAASFSLLAIAVFTFAWDKAAVAAIDLAPGLLWVIRVLHAAGPSTLFLPWELESRALDGILGFRRWTAS